MAGTITGQGNRILAHAAKVQAILDSGHKPDGSPLGDVEALEKSLKLELVELARYQELKSLAQLKGIISYEEAMTIYAALGESGDWPASTTLAMKVTVTNLMGQLIGAVR